MAIIGTDQEDDDELVQPNPGTPSVTTSSSGGMAGGTGSGSGQGATTGVAATGGQSNPGGGGYANLIQYLGANQDSGATTGQAAENVVKQSGDQAMGAQNAYGTSGASDIAAATAGIMPDQTNLTNIAAHTATVNPGMVNDLSSGKVSDVPKGYDQYTGATSIPEVSYTGPDVGSFTGQTASNLSDALGKSDIVSQNVKNAQGGSSGVGALLRGAYSQPNYTVGENTLDAFLAGGTPGGQQALAQAPGVGQAVSNNYAGINAMLGTQAAAGRQQAKDTNTTYQNAINDAMNTSKATADIYNRAKNDYKAQQQAIADVPKSTVKEPYFDPTMADPNISTTPAPNPNRMIGIGEIGGQTVNTPYFNGDPNLQISDYNTGIAPLRLSKGGKIPSYGKLTSMLRGKK